jgi:hypothetical protein
MCVVVSSVCVDALIFLSQSVRTTQTRAKVDVRHVSNGSGGTQTHRRTQNCLRTPPVLTLITSFGERSLCTDVQELEQQRKRKQSKFEHKPQPKPHTSGAAGGGCAIQ